MRMNGSALRKLAGAALLTVMAVVAAGCGGGDGDETVFAPAAGTESAYCDTHRAWQVHELDGGEGDEQPNPAALRKYWSDYLEFNRTSMEQAPPVIRDEWVASERGVRTIVTPVLVKYGYDFERIMREGTPAEKAVSQPPPHLQKAQDTIHAYEARVCGVDSPPAANVVFEADDSSKAYCTALGTWNSQLEKVESSRFDPDAMRTFLTADSFTEALDAMEAEAPAAIADDVEAETEWYRGRWSDVIAEHDYDIRRIWLDATPEDRAVFTGSHPDVVEHASRTTAYEEQVCIK